MKRIKTWLITIVVLLCSISARAHDFEVDGIYYNVISSSNLTVEVTFRGEYWHYYDEYQGVVKIPSTFFYKGMEYHVVSIGSGAFRECSGLTSLILPKSLTSIGDYAFYGCSGLTSITLPDGLTSIGERTFQFCSGLTSITLPKSLTSIGSVAFSGCSGLTSIILPDGLTSIGERTFQYCSSLTSINFSEGLTSIGSEAFSCCYGLTSINLPEGLTSIGGEAFESCSGLTSITLPESLTLIAESAFAYCTKIKSMTIKSGVLEIMYGGYGPRFEPVKVFWLANTPPEAVRKFIGKVNYVANEQYLSRLENCKVYPYLSSMFEVDGLKYVPVSPSERTCDVIDCIYGDSTLAVVNIGETVSYKGIDMKVKKVMPYSFSGNGILRDVVIADAVESVGTGCFANCSSLERVKVGSNVSEIGNDAFKDCPLLSDILIPNATKRIGNGAFFGCKSLSDVIIEDRSEPLALGCNYSSPLFSDCPLDSVYIGGKITYGTSSKEGYSPFYRNTSLRTVVITDREDQIYENEFYGCSNLKNVTIGNGVKSIGNYAFSGCSVLEGFSFGSSMESIGNEAFSDCTNLTQLTSYAVIPPLCGPQALDDINKWECVLKIPEGTNDAYMAADQWKEFFFIENLPAGINGIKLENGKCAPVYNLNGTRVKNTKNMPKGVYIINGKKVMVK